jgi:transcription-repair coupling factor (superfamily II helicase)
MREFTELGTGFNLAMRDLEIRGAGNLLGREQSGFIATMGFETYTRTLEEAVTELKEEEFQGLFEKQKKASLDDTVVDVHIEALIPSAYVAQSVERLAIYRRLYAVTSREQVLEIGEELQDRFGTFPHQVRALLDILMIRIDAAHLGFGKVKITKQYMDLEVAASSDQWGEERGSRLIAGISTVSDRSVSVRNTKDGTLIRVRLDPSEGILSAARKGLGMIAGILGRPS